METASSNAAALIIMIYNLILLISLKTERLRFNFSVGGNKYVNETKIFNSVSNFLHAVKHNKIKTTLTFYINIIVTCTFNSVSVKAYTIYMRNSFLFFETLYRIYVYKSIFQI